MTHEELCKQLQDAGLDARHITSDVETDECVLLDGNMVSLGSGAYLRTEIKYSALFTDGGDRMPLSKVTREHVDAFIKDWKDATSQVVPGAWIKEYIPKGGWMHYRKMQKVKGALVCAGTMLLLILAYALVGYIERGM